MFVNLRVVDISIHALLAESDHHRRVNLLRFKHFYPRSPCGERRPSMTVLHCKTLFLSTLSLRRATAALRQVVSAELYFYPRSPCGERPSPHSINCMTLTHFYPFRPSPQVNFYPRSPCGERRIAERLHYILSLFLSTLSLRRATANFSSGKSITEHFYPRSPCGERPFCYNYMILLILPFLSTLSLRRATS